MAYLAAEANQLYALYIVIWGLVLVTGLSAFGAIFYYTHRFFTARRVVEIYSHDGKREKKISYFNKGERVDISKLRLYRKTGGLKAVSISSDAEITTGSMDFFAMPFADVTVIYKKAFRKPTEKEQEKINKRTLPMPPSVKEISDKEVRPVLLLTGEDVTRHLSLTNSLCFFPICNRYKSYAEGDRQTLVLYAGEMIYAILIYTEVTFKALVRLDNAYVKEEMSEIDTVSNIKDDIYATIVDLTFGSADKFFDMLDHAYQYVVYSSYLVTDGKFYVKNEAVKDSNAELLALNNRIISGFDPVFDKAISEAKKYKEELEGLRKKEEAMDESMYAPKDLIYDDLKTADEILDPHSPDGYFTPLEFPDRPYRIRKASRYALRRDLPDIESELKDIKPVSPSGLKIKAIIDYVMARKDMVSLTIDVAGNMSRKPTTMRFQDNYFALVIKKARAYRINIRLDEDFVKNELVRKHPNIIRVRKNDDKDWYRLTLDETYKSYDEIYDILRKSYEYTKKSYYEKQSAGH